MDKNTSHKIIKDTLEGAFDKNKFLLFVKNLCNQIDESKAFQLSGAYIPDAFRGYIKSYERLGTFTDPEDKKIDVLIVYLQKDTSLERARTAQRNFVARYLKDRDQKDAGLVAFVSPNSEDWRFSLIKMEYKFTEGKSGKVKVKEEFTPARRWSFLVGANENSHTAKSRLAPIVQDDEHNPTLKIFEEAFNIEKVTKEFFEKYRDLFLRVKETLEDVVKKDPMIKKDFTAKGVDTIEFAKKLLGQIVFLYFLQKKGWFGVERDEDWGSGPKNFLRRLFEKKHSDYKNFFNDILEPLFYEALARERDDDFYSRFDCKIPFLNGGLFDPISNYDWVHTDIFLPDDLFSNTRKTKEGDVGDGILDIFDRYNFTVKEDEPLEKEVAVDPETLGKVFENLLEVKDRKSKGTYYTPREIVHYMCVQSLISYLATELEGKVSKEDLEQLIKYGETVGENETRVEEKGEETQTYHYKMPESVRLNAKLIDEQLSNIKVCDPAIGSGAFPVGMMTEIVRARNTLSSYLKDSGRTLYNFKRDCIQNSLYGVDVDPGAVEIAKLRLWLSLVVDEDDIKQIKPLPNLDYKIMQGNSLLEEFEGIQLFDEKLISAVNFDKEKQIEELKEKQNNLSSEYIKLHQASKLTDARKEEIDADLKKIVSQIRRLSQSEKAVADNQSLFDIYSNAKKKADELKKLHKEFFETTQKKKKDDLKKQIENLEWGLIEATLKEQGKISELKKVEEFKKSNIKPFFLWKLHFADVFQEKGGFDVVIANPPYIKEDVNRNAFDGLRKSDCYQGKMDIWYLFGSQGLDILKKYGVMTFIATNNWVTNDGASKFRNKIIKYGRIIDFIDFGDYKIFSAGIQTMVFVVIKDAESPEYDLKYAKLFDNNADGALLTSFLNEPNELPNHRFEKFKVSIRRSDYLTGYIKFIHPTIGKILDRIKKAGSFNLMDHEIFSGIDVMQDFVNKSHLEKLNGKISVGDGVFVLSEIEKTQIKWNNKELELIKPYYTTREIARYYASKSNRCWILYTGTDANEKISLYPNIKKHLDKFQKIITSVNKPYGLHRTRDEENFLGQKIFSIRKCAAPSFSLVDFPCYVSRAFLIIKTNRINSKCLLAILNSKVTAFWLLHKGKLQGNQFQVDKVPLMDIPIVCVQPSNQKSIIDFVDKILSLAKDNKETKDKIKEYEHQIDQVVYKLYELTPEEIEMVENFDKKM